MIEPTDEMVQLAVDKFLDGPSGTIGVSMRDALAAVLAIVERDRRAESEAAAEVVRAYRASVAKGYFRYPRGPVARAVDRLSRAVNW